MNQQPTNQVKRSTPWFSSLYSVGTALAGTGYLLWRANIAMEKAGGGVPDPEITSELWSHIWIVVAILVMAIAAGILNVVFVAKGGRKWTLIPSSIGILTSLGVIAFIAYSWMNQVGKL
jgi:hypothetical protein